MQQLPFELLESITVESWYLPFDRQDRLRLMKTSPLVCRFWLRAYHRILFIPSCSYVDHYFQLIFPENCLFRMDRRSLCGHYLPTSTSYSYGSSAPL
ncbi:hypothetical protein ARMGADRAFT_176108 [Armillaria gallica]|uniref:Uncharacterized protein n=1 Tax=Armillaria gallica TaxID=47427 RepID=A0A2H3CV80_ARMGA|nr:hypothetical protein ARMGADRAFT_176108 [Armillaria gallica]